MHPDGRTLAVANRAGNRDANRPWLAEQTTLSVIGVDGVSYAAFHGPYVSLTRRR